MEQLKKLTEELLKNDVFNFNEKDYDNFQEHIKGLFEKFEKDILNDKTFWLEFCKKHFNETFSKDDIPLYTERISNLSKNIKKSIESYLLGKTKEAYRYLEEGLNEITFKTSALFKGVDALKAIQPNELTLYRMRKREDKDLIYRNEMFHIPFQNRENVTTQRYSIPGHPCLYFSDSVYCCWEELNQPPINNVYVSRFQNDEELNVIEVLSLSEVNKRLSKKDSTDFTKELFRFLLTFPLNVACSIKTKNRKASFKHEYIIPQLFLQFVMENQTKIDGIRYFSTRINQDRASNVGVNNFVFPSKTNHPEGYCTELKKKFSLTYPMFVEYELINRANLGSVVKNSNSDVQIELIKGRRLPYDWTTFKLIEDVLSYDSMPLDKCS